MRRLFACLLLLLMHAPAMAQDTKADCGQIVSIATHEGTTTRYALSLPAANALTPPAVLVLMVGGGGDLRLDERGCARALEGNPVVRAIPEFLKQGLVSALVDTSSDYPGEEGLGGFRIAPAHAADLGKIIADLRARTHAPVWLVGHSRGTISVANAAAHLQGQSAPDGIVLMSAMLVGGAKGWVTQTVLSAPLEDVRMPVLVLGHADDKCVRSPAALMNRIIERTGSAREQTVTLTGGAEAVGAVPSVEACGARMPHGFFNLDAEFAAGIARFVRGERY